MRTKLIHFTELGLLVAQRYLIPFVVKMAIVYVRDYGAKAIAWIKKRGKSE